MTFYPTRSINNIKQLQKHYPADLREEGLRLLNELVGRRGQAAIGPVLAGQAALVLPLSRFLQLILRKYPGLLPEMALSGELSSSMDRRKFLKRMHDAMKNVSCEDDLLSVLRRFRNRKMFRIAWRDLSGTADLEEILSDLTFLADQCIEAALGWLNNEQAQAFGSPVYPDGHVQGLIVLAMGKLGAGELNFSSDIDLIFAYPLQGSTTGAGAGLSNEEFFTRLARRLCRALSLTTEEGMVFRVDTRLRPFGDSGPLVLPASAVEEYYENYGRQWERYAMVKARAAAGDILAGERLLKALRPFVYRKYLDYSAVDAMRQMKAMILAEQDRKALERDIKLGPGGIRDIEFICQAFQLLKGGRMPALQERYLLRVLRHLESLSLLDSGTCRLLREAYIFLRMTENRLQEFADQQVHFLPEDSEMQLRLAVAMGFSSWERFYPVLKGHMQAAHRIFGELFDEKQQQTDVQICTTDAGSESGGQHVDCILPDVSEGEYLLIWEAPEDRSARQQMLAMGFSEEAASRLLSLRNSRQIALMPSRTRDVLDRLIPKLIAVCTAVPDSDKALEGSLKVIDAVLRRGNYLVLLLEYPQALRHLVYLCSRSIWIAEILSRQPILLDELIDASALFNPLADREFRKQLDAMTASIPGSDLELFMDELRRFRKGSTLRVAACDLDNLIDVREVGASLTGLACILVDKCLESAIKHVACNKEEPFYPGFSVPEHCGMAVVAYGKMGGREMGYASDLDLVFLYDPAALSQDGQVTAGDAGYYFSRMVQRLIFLITTRTSQGRLYQIDTRLRPNGSQGILVSSLESFAEYQRARAWLWEHQALVRARAVAGDKVVKKTFEDIRKDCLMTKRKAVEVAEGIHAMRKKIWKAATGNSSFFHIKKHPGGVMDIEFLVQYLVLCHARIHEELVRFTGCLDLLQILGDLGLLSQAQAHDLSQAYRHYAKAINHRTLDMKSARVDANAFRETRARVEEIFSQVVAVQ